MKLFRLTAVCAVVMITMTSCGHNQAEKNIHPELVHIRVMLEHGFTFTDYEKAVQSTRYDFELHKD